MRCFEIFSGFAAFLAVNLRRRWLCCGFCINIVYRNCRRKPRKVRANQRGRTFLASRRIYSRWTWCPWQGAQRLVRSVSIFGAHRESWRFSPAGRSTASKTHRDRQHVRAKGLASSHRPPCQTLLELEIYFGGIKQTRRDEYRWRIEKNSPWTAESDWRKRRLRAALPRLDLTSKCLGLRVPLI